MTTESSPSPVVVGVDGSASSRLALEWAAEEASRRRLSIHLVHAFGLEYPPLTPVSLSGVVPDTALREARERLDSIAPGVPVSTDASNRSASAALVKASEGADTVVVGAGGRGRLAHALLGSTSVQVATHAACPVVVVHERPAAASAGATPPRVILGVDGSHVSRDAIGYAFAQAAGRGRGLTVVHAWWLEASEGLLLAPSPEEELARIGEGEDTLVQRALAPWTETFPSVDVQVQVVRGHPVDALVAQSSGGELVVMGTRGHGGFTGLLLGSVSRGVIYRAHCPVAVVRSRAAHRSGASPGG